MSELEPLRELPDAEHGTGPADLGIALGGGGARAAYHAGFLRALARIFPDLVIPYVTGVSAGAINAAHVASHHGRFIEAIEELSHLWGNLTVEDVFRVDLSALTLNLLRWAKQLVSGGAQRMTYVRGLVDTDPLRKYLNEALHAVDSELTGIHYNIETGRLKAAAISTSSYTTGQSTTWVQGRDITSWARPHRRSRRTILTVEHVMASTAIPLFFPAINIAGSWHGDGSVRLTAPLSPAVHLGARRIIAISTRYRRSDSEADRAEIEGYPPPAQVAGVLLNSIFLDLLDNDAVELERLNALLKELPPALWHGMRPLRLLILRPSVDLGQLAQEFEPRLPHGFRFLSRGLGTRQTTSPDLLSFVLFQPDYLRALLEIGERDGLAHAVRIREFLRNGDQIVTPERTATAQ